MQQEVDYRSNFPKIFCIFDRPTSKFPTRKTNQTSGNHNNFPKKDQVQEQAPYTVIQIYADRLRYTQSKRGVTIKLTDPEITTKHGLPAVLYVKDEVIN